MAKVRKEKVQNTTVTIAAVATPPKKEKKKMSAAKSPLTLAVESVEEITPDFPDAMEVEKNGETPDWPKDDDMELFQHIKKALPADDTMKYESRINHVDWEAISFGEYSADECKQRWIHVQGHLRRYRLVTELVEDAIAWRLRPWTNFNKGSKCQKHPEYPKKPLTSYMIFYMEKKDEILEKQPGLGMTELSKVIAKQYNEMNDRKKQKYTEQAKKEKELFELKLKKFMLDHPDYIPLKSEKMPMKALPPKVPTPFKLFCDTKMAKFQGEGMNGNEARDKCRETYKELNDKQRLKWIYKSLQLEKQYNDDLEKFKAEHPEVEVGAKKSILSKDEKHLKEKTEGKPEKPPNSGYSLYSKKLLASSSLKHLESKERMTEISRMWKELKDEERKLYNEEAQQLILNYKMEYASYLESLQPEQRVLELKNSQPKALGAKRSPAKTKQSEEKKIKLDDEQVVQALNFNADEDEVDEDDDSSDAEDNSADKDVHEEAKSTIQKPKSSLQMFCDTNLEKYKKKNPKMSQQELSRHMAKTFSKLSEDKKKMYENMAQKSKKESPTITIKLPAKSPTTKPSAKATLTSVAAKDTKSKKPALNATAKSTTKSTKKEVEKEKPLWILKQHLYTNEPPKPPENPAFYYAFTVLKDDSLSPKVIEERWNKLGSKQKKKHTTDHAKKQQEYVKEFENFVRNLPSEELKVFRSFMKNREKKINDNSSDEDSDSSKEDVEEENNSSEGDSSDSSSD